MAFIRTLLLLCSPGVAAHALTHYFDYSDINNDTAKSAPWQRQPFIAGSMYPLKVSANKRYLVDRNNVPFLLIGDSPQSLVANASIPDAAAYFADRASQGFNCAFIQLVCDQFIAGRPNGATWDGIVPFTSTFDFSTPNLPYWQRVDEVINTAAKYNICCMLAFFLDWVYSWPSQYDTLLRAYASSPVMPTFLGEAQYEYQTVIYLGTPLRLRLQEWWTMTCGATGILYGNGNVLTFADASWKKFVVSPGATQLGYLSSLLSSIRWYDLIPDTSHHLLISGLGRYISYSDPAKNTYATAAMTFDGTTALIYAPTVRTMTVDMSRFSTSVWAKWFDPSNGSYIAISGSPFANSGTQKFTPVGNNGAGDGDWVLLFTASN